MGFNLGRALKKTEKRVKKDLLVGVLPGMLKKEKVNKSTEAQEQASGMARDQYETMRSQSQGLEDKLFAEINDPNLISGAVAKAGASTTAGMEASLGAQQREAGRYGAVIAGQKAESMNRLNDLNAVKAGTSNMNTARLSADDYKSKILESLGQIGAKKASDALKITSDAATMEANRNATNEAIASTNQAQKWGAVGTAAALMI
jgi:hypothetical protein